MKKLIIAGLIFGLIFLFIGMGFVSAEDAQGGPTSTHCQQITTEEVCNSYGANICLWNGQTNSCVIRSNSCSVDSDCEVDVCAKNSCINKDYNRTTCSEGICVSVACAIPPNMWADYCKCENNVCVGYRGEEVNDCATDSDCPNPALYFCDNGRCLFMGDTLGCKSYYWFDNSNKECSQKEFCGAFMYYGLQTFETKGECEKALNLNSGIEGENCKKKGELCGGIAGFVCCEGIICYYGEDEGMPDSTGVCVTESLKDKVKIMPETASLKARERLGELGFDISLKEVGTGNGDKVVYDVSAEKEGKIFGLFRAKGKVTVFVNAETGDVLSIKKPWWAFLASGI